MTTSIRHELRYGAEMLGFALLLSFALCAGCERMAHAVPPGATVASLSTRGDSVFHGLAGGGSCFTCHQANAKGLPGLAPADIHAVADYVYELSH